MTSKIEWTDETWNPISGCSHSGSPGCDHCYAKRMAQRLKGRYGYPADDPFRVTFHPDRRSNWTKPKRVFVCSMSDFNHPDVEWNWQYKIMERMFVNSHHTHIILTKRPAGLAKRLDDIYFHLGRNYGLSWDSGKAENYPFPLKNLWLGVTVCNQEEKSKIGILRQIPAAIRWISFEPLLEDPGEINFDGIGWCIVGGETGPGARPMHPDWARSIRDQCVSAGVPFFFKQWGEWVPDDFNTVTTSGRTPKRCWMDKATGEVFDYPSPYTDGMMWDGKKAAGRHLDGKIWEQYPG